MNYEEILESLKHLKYLRDNFSEDIPREILHSILKNPYYKVRKNWFVDVMADAENIIKEEYASPQSKKLFLNFLKIYKSNDFKRRITTKEDIKRGNEILNSLIKDLEKIIQQIPY